MQCTCMSNTLFCVKISRSIRYISRSIRYLATLGEISHYGICRGSGEPAHLRSLARTYAVRSRKLKAEGKFQPKNYNADMWPG